MPTIKQMEDLCVKDQNNNAPRGGSSYGAQAVFIMNNEEDIVRK